jgi:hypothetical protein
MTTTAMAVDRPEAVEFVSTTETTHSAVSWGAVIAGACAAGSLSVVLVALGAGLGLASVSPWPYAGASATTLKAATIVWLIIVQWLSAGLGGYLTGRLRSRGVDVHPHESYFRDSANGFVTWAVATVLVALMLSTGLAAAVGTATRGAATVAAAAGTAQPAGAAAATSAADPTAYFVDAMFRADTPNATAADRETRTEAGRIFAQGLKNGDLTGPDRSYLVKLVSARTGLSQADSEKRVSDSFAQAKDAEAQARQTADKIRRATAQLAMFTALSMMVGAFIAAAAGALGGVHRDEGWDDRRY